jgi:glycosyltransferase involved in cell wall biosynthesis
MADEPLISVCIPAYNQTALLRKTLDSLVIQTFKNFETIVSDDSTDNAVELLVNEYSQKLGIRYYKNEVPLGSPANWNRCLDLCKGTWIKMLHHDDWLAAKDALQKFAFHTSRDPDLIFCDTEIANHTSGTSSFNKPGRQFIQLLEEDPSVLFNNNRIGAPSVVMFKRSQARFDTRLKYLVDVEFYWRLLSYRKKFVYIEEALVVNTSHHPGQVTAASLNKETQVGEYSYLYNRLFAGKIPSLEICRLFIYLFQEYGVKNLDEIRKWGYEEPRPEWYFKLLLYISKLKNN